MVPDFSLSNPRSSLSKVLLPAPLGPRTETNSPCPIVPDIPSRMCRPPRLTTTFSRDTTGAAPLAAPAACISAISFTAAGLFRTIFESRMKRFKLLEHPGTVILVGRHCFAHAHHRNAGILRFLLQMGGNRCHGL